MTIVCPHCGHENEVAGWYTATATPAHDGHEPMIAMYCGFCGQRFAKAASWPRDVAEMTGSKPLPG